MPRRESKYGRNRMLSPKEARLRRAERERLAALDFEPGDKVRVEVSATVVSVSKGGEDNPIEIEWEAGRLYFAPHNVRHRAETD